MAAPVILQLHPAAIPTGATLRLTVYGTGFDGTSVVYFGATALATTFITSKRIRGAVPAGLLTAAGAVSVTVLNPGGTSAAATFTVFDGLPESAHPYDKDPFTITYTQPGSPANIWVQFDQQTYASTYPPNPTFNDTINVSNGIGFSQNYQGTALAGLTVSIPGDTVIIQFGPGGSPSAVAAGGNYFGFRVRNIRTTAPPATGYYLLGNRNAEDQTDPIANGPSSSFPGPLAATHDPAGSPQIISEVAVSQSYSYQFTFPNATGAVVWTLTGTLPTGITLNATSGLLSGTAPASAIARQVTITATDSIGNVATGLFLLRVFRNPVQVSAVLPADLGQDISPPGNLTDFPWAFPHAGAIFCVLQHKLNAIDNSTSPLVRSSADGGSTWSTVNTGETNVADTEHIDAWQHGSTVVYAFWNGGPATATVKSYNLDTNTYTPLYVGHSYSQQHGLLTDIFIRPDASVVQFLTGTPQDPLLHSPQVYMVTALGVTDTIISTNVPDTPITDEATLLSVIMDATGAFHVFFRAKIGAAYSVCYRRVAPDNTLGTIQTLDSTYFTFTTGTLQGGIGHGFVRAEADEIVVPVSTRFLIGDGGAKNNIVVAMRGTPISAPVWTYEIVDCVANLDQSNEQYFSPFATGMYALEALEGSDVIFFTGFDQYLSNVDFGAVWMVRNPRNGSGWTYRDRYYDAVTVPMYAPVVGDDQFTYRLCAIPDATAESGYRLGFLGNPGDNGTTAVDAAIMMLLYPSPPAPVITCGSPPDGRIGNAYTHTFPVSGGSAPFTFAITAGALPNGLTLNTSTGVVSGIPTVQATFSFTIRVTDAILRTSSVACQIIVVRFTVSEAAIHNIWTSGLCRGQEVKSAMIRVGAMDIWARGNAPLDVDGNPTFLITVYGPDGVTSVPVTLLSQQGIPSALNAQPGIIYMSKYDIHAVEDVYVSFETTLLDAWFELSSFRLLVKPDLTNR